MQLTTQEELLVEKKIKNYGKSTTVSYLLWFFLGIFGAHRFYHGRIKSGIAMAALYVLATIMMVAPLISTLASSGMSEYMQCVQKNPQTHEQVCDPSGIDIDELPASATATMGLAGILYLAIFIWWIVDAFLIPGMVRRNNDKLRDKFEDQILRQRDMRRERAYDDRSPQQPYESERY